VLETFISSINTSLQMLVPFTASFIKDSLLQTMQQLSQPLVHFTDIKQIL